MQRRFKSQPKKVHKLKGEGIGLFYVSCQFSSQNTLDTFVVLCIMVNEF